MDSVLDDVQDGFCWGESDHFHDHPYILQLFVGFDGVEILHCIGIDPFGRISHAEVSVDNFIGPLSNKIGFGGIVAGQFFSVCLQGDEDSLLPLFDVFLLGLVEQGKRIR